MSKYIKIRHNKYDIANDVQDQRTIASYASLFQRAIICNRIINQRSFVYIKIGQKHVWCQLDKITYAVPSRHINPLTGVRMKTAIMAVVTSS